MNKKIVFFDIDGTLVDDNKDVPESTLEAIQTLKDNGHFVAIATGRPPFTFEDLREKLGITTYVCLNGQYVVHQDKVIYKHALDPGELERLVQDSTGKQHPLVFVNGHGWDANMKDHPYIVKSINSLRVDAELAFKPESFKQDAKYQVMIFCEEGEELQYIENYQQFDFVRWHDYSVDILPKGGSKAVGIQKLLEVLSIGEEHAYAYGDGLNDKEMLEFIPNSVAMGNAVDSIKSVAKHVTRSVDDNGIHHSLQKFGLI